MDGKGEKQADNTRTGLVFDRGADGLPAGEKKKGEDGNRERGEVREEKRKKENREGAKGRGRQHAVDGACQGRDARSCRDFQGESGDPDSLAVVDPAMAKREREKRDRDRTKEAVIRTGRGGPRAKAGTGVLAGAWCRDKPCAG